MRKQLGNDGYKIPLDFLSYLRNNKLGKDSNINSNYKLCNI